MLYGVGSTTLILFAVSMGLVGFTLYGPDALMTGAGAIDVGSPRSATLAAGIINGMGSVGSVVQEIVLGMMLAAGALNMVFGALLASSMGAAAALGWLLVRNHRGLADM